MFRKPFHVKSNTNMRGSERRNLKSRLAECFSSLTPEDATEIFPNKATVNVMKLTTHSGDDCLVYLLESQPLFFEVNDRLYPTVYMLWTHPGMIPSLTTWPPVFEKLSKGADLMLPGVLVPPVGLPDLLRNRPCSISLQGNRAAMAMGTATMSSQAMVDAGMKGKGVSIIHCFGDHLWEVGNKSLPPSLSDITEPSAEDVNTDGVANDNASANEDQTVSENGGGGEPTKDGEAADPDGIMKGEGEEEESLSPAEQMDTLLYQALLHCLKTRIKATDLPMTTIILYRTHMRSVCPPDVNLDVKKSSHKKLGKFLSFAQSKGLLEVKETSKGVDSLMGFDRRHNDLTEFEVPENVFSDDSTPEQKFEIPSEGGKDAKGGWQASLNEMYSVTATVLPIMEPFGYRKGSWMKLEEVRLAVTEYIKSNGLVDPLNRSQVTLGPHLHDALMERTEGYITQLSWDQVFKRCFAKMSSGYQMLPTSQTTSSSRAVIKGKLKPISLKIERKAGNKLMTVIQNLDSYSIDLKEFAHKLQIGVAASATITQGQGQKSGQEVRVQGNQVTYLEKLLLDEYQIPRKYVQGLDLAPKSKKKR